MALIAYSYGIMSVLAFLAYGVDKRGAARGRRRVRERTLHLLDALGGFPGGLLAQQCLRHKTRKVSFQVVFWLTVAAHAAGWIAWGRLR